MSLVSIESSEEQHHIEKEIADASNYLNFTSVNVVLYFRVLKYK